MKLFDFLIILSIALAVLTFLGYLAISWWLVAVPVIIALLLLEMIKRW